ncbi:Muscleblind-like protein, partial [Bienertia sinuspersici]
KDYKVGAVLFTASHRQARRQNPYKTPRKYVVTLRCSSKRDMCCLLSCRH